METTDKKYGNKQKMDVQNVDSNESKMSATKSNHSSNGEAYGESLQSKLAAWCIKNKISDKAMNELLAILNGHIGGLPMNVQELKRTLKNPSIQVESEGGELALMLKTIEQLYSASNWRANFGEGSARH